MQAWVLIRLIKIAQDDILSLKEMAHGLENRYRDCCRRGGRVFHKPSHTQPREFLSLHVQPLSGCSARRLFGVDVVLRVRTLTGSLKLRVAS